MLGLYMCRCLTCMTSTGATQALGGSLAQQGASYH